MSVLEYDIGRHDLSHALPYGNYYYTNRNAPLALSYATRSDPRGYPTSRPVNGTRGRSGASREDVSSESGQSRRRIAVAVSYILLLYISLSPLLSIGTIFQILGFILHVISVNIVSSEGFFSANA